MLQKLRIAFFAAMAVMLIAPVSLFAATGKGEVNQTFGIGANQGAGGAKTSVAEIIGIVVKFLLGLVGALSVLVIVIAGIMYIVSGGDEGKVDKAKSWITYALIGLAIAILGYIIVNTVITELGGGGGGTTSGGTSMPGGYGPNGQPLIR